MQMFRVGMRGDSFTIEFSYWMKKLIRANRLQNSLNKGCFCGIRPEILKVPFRKQTLADLEEDVIKEPITEEEEEVLSEKRIERKARHTVDVVAQLREKLDRTKLRSDEEIWREIQEKEAKKDTKNRDEMRLQINSTEIESHSPYLPTGIDDDVKSIVSNTDTASVRIENRVHFNQNSDESDSTDDGSIAPPLELKFTFSDINPKPYFSPNSGYLTPWDIYNNYKCTKAKKRTSILKNTDTGTRYDIFGDGQFH